jgi:hypothetical protein
MLWTNLAASKLMLRSGQKVDALALKYRFGERERGFTSRTFGFGV